MWLCISHFCDSLKPSLSGKTQEENTTKPNSPLDARLRFTCQSTSMSWYCAKRTSYFSSDGSDKRDRLSENNNITLHQSINGSFVVSVWIPLFQRRLYRIFIFIFFMSRSCLMWQAPSIAFYLFWFLGKLYNLWTIPFYSLFFIFLGKFWSEKCIV